MHSKIGILALGLLALASSILSAAALDQVTTSFNLPAQPLAESLRAVAGQTSSNILFDGRLVQGITAKALKADLSIEQALKELLTGTGLTYRNADEKTVMIVPVGKQSLSTQRSDGKTDGSSSPYAAGEGSGARLAQAGAQGESNEKSSASAESGESSVKLEEVVVTAQKRKEILKDVPISISVLSGDSLDKSTFTGVMEALRTVPGVAPLPNGALGGGTALTIRGATAAGNVFTGSSPVGYYLDGVPFNLIRDAITPDQNSFDLDRVEVLRGPQGTLYGASAQNGLVRVLTRNADLNQFELKGRSTLSQTDGASSINYRGDLAVNVPLVPGKLAARAVVGYDSTDGWIDTPVREGSNSARARTYRLKVNAQPTELLSIVLSSWINRTNKDAGPYSDADARRGFLDNTPVRVPTEPEPMVEDYEADNLQVTYEFSAFTLTSSSSYLNYKGIGNIDYDRYFLLPGTTRSVAFTEIPSRSYSEEVLLNSGSDSAWKWTAGALYQDIRGSLHQRWELLARPVSFVDKSKSVALFGQVGRRFGDDKFEWTLGARYFRDTVSEREDDISIDPATGIRYFVKKHNSATTPRAVLTWYPSRDSTIYASYAQGFRSGPPQNFTVGLSHPDISTPNPDKLDNYEVGAKFDLLDRRLSFDVAAYYIKWKDVIQTFPVPYGATLVTALGNGVSASGPGIDFSVVVRPADGLELGLSSGWNDLKQDADVYTNLARTTQAFAKGDRLAGSPELTSSAFIHLQRALGASGYRGALSISASYMSEMFANSPAAGQRIARHGDDLVFGQAKFSVEAPSGWSASLFVDNFTNEYGNLQPINPAAYYALDAGTHFRPRTVGMQFEYRYNSH